MRASRPWRPIRALQQRLGELEIPVAEDIPDKPIDGVGGVVEAIGLDRVASTSATAFAVSPMIQALSVIFTACRIEPRDAEAIVHFGETRRVPKLCREIAIAFDFGSSKA